jgi:hypothetical protein
MTRAVLRAALGAAVVAIGISPADAQTRKPPRFEVSAGALFVAGYSGSEKNADITANQSGGAPYTLFKSEPRIDSSPAYEARIGVRVSPTLTLEGTARPELSSRLSSDVEGIPDVTVVEDLSVYIIDVAVLGTFGTAPTSRVTPFVRIGAGYVRELHDDNALVQTGGAFHAGGGVTMWFNGGQTVGLRADARVYVIRGGIDLDGGTRTQAAGAGALVVAF